jgi:hypothetical protein
VKLAQTPDVLLKRTPLVRQGAAVVVVVIAALDVVQGV